MSATSPTYKDVVAADARMKGKLHRTQVCESLALNNMTGGMCAFFSTLSCKHHCLPIEFVVQTLFVCDVPHPLPVVRSVEDGPPPAEQTFLAFSVRCTFLLPARILVKAENLQWTGTFKIRGAMNRVLCLSQVLVPDFVAISLNALLT
jgi:threonine dehydratase